MLLITNLVDRLRTLIVRALTAKILDSAPLRANPNVRAICQDHCEKRRHLSELSQIQGKLRLVMDLVLQHEPEPPSKRQFHSVVWHLLDLVQIASVSMSTSASVWARVVVKSLRKWLIPGRLAGNCNRVASQSIALAESANGGNQTRATEDCPWR